MKLYEEIDKMENNIGIDSCYDIIQDNSKSSLKLSLDTADGNGFENVKKPKENKTDDDEASGLGNPEHGDEKTDYLIDDDPLIVFFHKEYFGFF